MHHIESVLPSVLAVLNRISFIGVFLILGYSAFFRPQTANWDFVMYIANAKIASGVPVSDVFSSSWSLFRQYLESDKFASLCCGNQFRYEMFRNEDAFISYLPIYAVKVGYVYAIVLVSCIFGYVESPFVISFFSAFVVLLIVSWRYSSLKGALRLLWLPGLLLGGIPSLAASPTPDALATAIYAAGALFWIQRKQTWALIFFALGVAVRPDNILLCVFIGATYFLAGEYRKGAILIFSSAIIYIICTQSTHHVGWWTHFYLSNVKQETLLTNFHPKFDILTFLKAEIYGAYMAIKYHAWPWLLFIMNIIVTHVSGRRLLYVSDRYDVMFLAVSAATVARFFLFPWYEDRLYAPTLIFLFILLPRYLEAGLRPDPKVDDPREACA